MKGNDIYFLDTVLTVFCLSVANATGAVLGFIVIISSFAVFSQGKSTYPPRQTSSTFAQAAVHGAFFSFLLEVFSLGITLLVQVQIFGKLRGQPTSRFDRVFGTSLQSPSSSGKAIAYEA